MTEVCSICPFLTGRQTRDILTIHVRVCGRQLLTAYWIAPVKTAKSMMDSEENEIVVLRAWLSRKCTALIFEITAFFILVVELHYASKVKTLMCNALSKFKLLLMFRKYICIHKFYVFFKPFQWRPEWIWNHIQVHCFLFLQIKHPSKHAILYYILYSINYLLYIYLYYIFFYVRFLLLIFVFDIPENSRQMFWLPRIWQHSSTAFMVTSFEANYS